MPDAMTGPQHWQEAERLEDAAAFCEIGWRDEETPGVANNIAYATLLAIRAQVHATLASAAATYERTNAAGNNQQWLNVLTAGEKGKAPDDPR